MNVCKSTGLLWTGRRSLVVVAVACVMCASYAQAGTKNWTGVTGDWFNVANWVEGSVPVASDDVFITVAGSSVLLTNDTEYLSSLTLSREMVFSNWNSRLQATSVTIQSGGVMTLPVAFTNGMMSNNVYIVCSNLTVDSGGEIAADGCGFAGGDASASSPDGDGYGTGRGVANAYGVGGGHGGRGGPSVNYYPDRDYPGAHTYGSQTVPLAPGSGGGGSSGSGGLTLGGSGGGAVFIDADGAVVVDGTISANGSDGSGGGSGGSVYIKCDTFDGTGGLVTANGGTGYPQHNTGGHGGGGRIAVDYNTSAQATVPDVGFEAKPGSLAGHYSRSTRGDMGTLQFPDNKFFTETISGISGQVWGFNSLSRNNLTVSNVWVRFAEEGFQLRVTNNLTITGSSGMLQVGGSTDIEFYQSDPRYASDTVEYGYGPTPVGVSTPPVVDVGDSLILTNGGDFTVYSAATNGATDYGALVSVTNDIRVGSNSYIYPYSHPTNGAAVRLRMRDLVVDASGTINGTGKGYSGGYGTTNGYGPSGATSCGYSPGGGYGGYGAGSLSVGFGGDANGVATNPVSAGSGGGSYSGLGGNGGARIWIDADRDVTVNGIVETDGSWASGGGGSGGAIRIRCERLLGAGVIRANGGHGGGPHLGGGGGGRIAALYDTAIQSNAPSIQFQAEGGDEPVGHPGGLGTIYFPNTLFLASPIADIKGQIVEVPSLSYEALTVSNAVVRFPAEGFSLTVTNDLRIEGAGTELKLGGSVVHRLYHPIPDGNSIYNRERLLSGQSQPVQLDVGGDLVLADGGGLYIYSAMTNGAMTNGAQVDVAGTVSIGSNCFIYPQSHPTNGGSVHFHIGSLNISQGGGIDADGRGCSGIDGTGTTIAYGTGASHCSAYQDGAGYGGHGGNNVYNHGGGITYGSSNAPIDAGSGGGGANSGGGGTYFGRAGGGLIWVEAAGTISLSGRLGADCSGAGSGAGSGGGIYIKCKRLSGVNGVISANGGDAVYWHSGAGGGGRIAIWRERDEWSGLTAEVNAGAVSFNGGTPPTNRAAFDGSIVWVMIIPKQGTVFVFR